ncbi:YibE/F family protein [Thermodesulfobium narugense DSM 14796]|uniref:YibE/F family protein n=1 Tax=Thermodesulfobium narugense DSM 14796 TaxID=747365 RepID=M1E4C1_9BACT|nr:YibE/F family protein [Thermodesulfobium narugense]AEE13977.1 YibE/F family protein [Thermodesulfobium narugense DSM 14796]
MKKTLFIFFFLSFYLSIFFVNNAFSDPQNQSYEEAKIVSISKEVNKENPNIEILKTKIRLLTGVFKDKEFITDYIHQINSPYDLKLSPGENVIVYQQIMPNKEPTFFISDIARCNKYPWLLLAFFLLIFIASGLRGIYLMLGLMCFIFFLWLWLIPALITNLNILFVTIAVLFMGVVIQTVLMCGFSQKALAAIIGTFSGIIIASIFSYHLNNFLNVTGIISEEGLFLKDINLNINFTNLLSSAMLIGSTGAAIKLSTSIVSTAQQYKMLFPTSSWKEIFNSSFNSGRESLPELLQTLYFAYIGCYLPLILLVSIQGPTLSWFRVFSLEVVATEIARSFIAIIVLFVTLPITSFLISRFLSSNIVLNLFLKTIGKILVIKR